MGNVQFGLEFTADAEVTHAEPLAVDENAPVENFEPEIDSSLIEEQIETKE